MNKITHGEFLRQIDGSDVQDGRFFCINCVMVELITADDGDYIVAYKAHDVCGPDHSQEIAAVYNAEHCVGVLHIPGDQWAKANSIFGQVFSIAMKDGLAGVTRYYAADLDDDGVPV